MVAWIIWFLAFTMILVSTIACAYYVFLALVAIFSFGKASRPSEKPSTDFAIVVPAHDEEGGIGAVLNGCAALDYPKELFTIYIVADNCSDKTAAIAKAKGINVLERTDESLKGKGYALAWAFPSVLKAGHDAVVVLDADCFLDDNALRHFDHLIGRGYKALQAAYVPSNPDASPESFAVAVGSALENDYFYAPKSKLGLSILLRGTGMVLHRDILEAHPWSAHSIVEDAEYSIEILQAGIDIKFLENVAVNSEFPVDMHQMKVQRTRWASGNFELGKKNSLKMIAKGLTERDLVVADIGLTMLLLSRPVVLGVLLMGLFFSGLASWMGAWGGANLLGWALVLCTAQAGYLLLGVCSLGITRHRLDLLKKTPPVVWKLFLIAVQGIFGVEKDNWARTPRKNDG